MRIYDGISFISYVSASHISHDSNTCAVLQCKLGGLLLGNTMLKEMHLSEPNSLHLFSSKTEGRSTASGAFTFHNEAEKLKTVLTT